MTSEHFKAQMAAWWDWLSDQVGGEGASPVERSFLDDCQNAALEIESLTSKLGSYQPVIDAARKTIQQIEQSSGAMTMGRIVDQWTLPSSIIELREAIEGLKDG